MNICKIDDCDTKVQARGWCNTHYNRWKNHGDPSILLLEKRAYEPGQQCSIEDCDSTIYGRGWCHKHYARWYRHGDPEIGARIRYGEDQECAIEDCDSSIYSRDWCRKHYARWRIHGDPLVMLKPTYDVIQYKGLHDRIRSERGTPSLCEHCNTTDGNFEWAFDWPNVLPEDTLVCKTRNSPYTLDIYKYIRLCNPCHFRFDGKSLNKKEPIDA